MENNRRCGILLPVFSLPNDYGIGSFGAEAYEFVDFLAATGQRVWQILPLCRTSYGDSPYQSPSAYAGNPYFIDLRQLEQKGLLTAAEVRRARAPSDTIDYAALYRGRDRLLRKAFARFEPTAEYDAFVAENPWLDGYARFMANKHANGDRAWNEWTKTDERDAAFEKFVQFEFFAQWRALKRYANDRGIAIVGDIPIYIAYDSAEVWETPRYFQLTPDGTPEAVAGVPPDGFSADGQLWGNPLYRWEEHEKDGFSWWIARIEHALSLYDIVRIDHFRGFAAYYSIPYGDKTARNGVWKKAPGSALFRAFRAKHPDAPIIAEDLGYLDEDVWALLRESGYPGMKVAQFGFSEPQSIYDPATYPERCVAYTGTHDSPPSRYWARRLSPEDKARFCEKSGKGKYESYAHAAVRYVLGSKAELAVIPMQDYMGLGRRARINEPATARHNWIWRLPPDYARFAKKIVRLCKKSGRLDG